MAFLSGFVINFFFCDSPLINVFFLFEISGIVFEVFISSSPHLPSSMSGMYVSSQNKSNSKNISSTYHNLTEM